MSTIPFTYEPLDFRQRSFRLLRLFAGHDDCIRCDLFHAMLEGEEGVPFEALSYTWGDPTDLKTIFVDDKAFTVTKNLHLALFHLRYPDEDRILWVDAICIDQQNTVERGHQVQKMRLIYSWADRVIFWLGAATSDTDVLMDALYELTKRRYELYRHHLHVETSEWSLLWSFIDPKSSHRRSEGLQDLLKRDWFRRVWILQEVANAKRAVVCCGSKVVAAYIFRLSPILMRIDPEPHCQAVLDIMPDRYGEVSRCKIGDKRDLYNLLLKFGKSRASDPRDLVYALLGLSAQGEDILVPDYTKSEVQVINDTSLALFNTASSLTTMEAFLKDFRNMNTKYLCWVVRNRELLSVQTLYEERNHNFRLDYTSLDAAAANSEFGDEMVHWLFEQCPRQDFTRRWDRIYTSILNAARNKGCGSRVMELLLDFDVKLGSNTLTAIVAAAMENTQCGLGIIKLLLEKQSDAISSKDLLLAVQLDSDIHKQIIQILFKHRGQEVIKTVFEIAKRWSKDHLPSRPDDSLHSWDELFIPLILRQAHVCEVKITEETFLFAVAHTTMPKCSHTLSPYYLQEHGGAGCDSGAYCYFAEGRSSNLGLLLEHHTEDPLTEEVLVSALNAWVAPGLIKSLLQRKRRIIPTKESIVAAMGQWHLLGSLREDLFREGNIYVTEDILVAATAHAKCDQVFKDIVERSTCKFVTKKALLKVAVSNEDCGLQILDILLWQEHNAPEIDEMILRAVVRGVKCTYLNTHQHAILDSLDRRMTENDPGLIGHAKRLRMYINALGYGNEFTYTKMWALLDAYKGERRLLEAERLILEFINYGGYKLNQVYFDGIGFLVLMYLQQGKFAKASDFLLEELKVRRAYLGDSAPQTLSVVIHLALSYEKQGKCVEAEALVFEVMESSKAKLVIGRSGILRLRHILTRPRQHGPYPYYIVRAFGPYWSHRWG